MLLENKKSYQKLFFFLILNQIFDFELIFKCLGLIPSGTRVEDK